MTRGVVGAVVAVLVLAGGCGADPAESGARSPMPLAEGHRWTYSTALDFQSAVQELRVAGPVAVDGRPGWRLTSPMGESRLAWQDGVLYGSELAGTRYAPAVPIYAPGTRRWSGTVTSPAGSEDATALLTMDTKADEKFRIGGRDFDVTSATLTVTTATREFTVRTWYAAGVGVIRQMQWTGERRTVRLEYVDGP